MLTMALITQTTSTTPSMTTVIVTSTVEMGQQADEEPPNVSHLHQGQGQLYAA